MARGQRKQIQGPSAYHFQICYKVEQHKVKALMDRRETERDRERGRVKAFKAFDGWERH